MSKGIDKVSPNGVLGDASGLGMGSEANSI